MSYVKNNIKKEFEALNRRFIVLLDVPAKNYFDSVMESANFVVEKEKKGVYVSVSRPFRYISNEMQRRNINMDNILFIDCISAMAGEHDNGNEKCMFVKSPSALEEISINITSLIDKIECDEKFLIMDSVSTLLIYNSMDSVKEFLLFLIKKLRLERVSGIIITVEKETSEEIKQILIEKCDKAIHV